MRAAACTLARAAACATIALCLCGFAGYLILAATPSIKKSEAVKSNLPIASLSGANVLCLLLTWLSLLVATFATLALRRLPPAHSARPTRATSPGFVARVRR